MKNEQYKLTKAQAIAGFLEEERADELDIITRAMTREQHIAAAEAAGISRGAQAALFEKQNRKLRELLEKQGHSLPPENVVPIRQDVPALPPSSKPKRRFFTRRDAAVGGVFATLATAATLVAAQLTTAAPVVLPLLATASAPTTASPPPHTADDMRNEAFAHCAVQEWAECIQLFDDAKRIDPRGDGADRVAKARAIAEREIAKPPKQ